MTQLLESTMLICFGFSWPMTVIKNWNAKTAKNMSLPFLILIITGYVAGITAKLLSGKINYVLTIYILNLVIVSLNLFIYGRNRKMDRQKPLCKPAVTLPITKEVEAKMEEYAQTDKVACQGGVLIVTDQSTADVPFRDWEEDLGVPLYPRYYPDLRVGTALDVLRPEIAQLRPSKIVLYLGATDMDSPHYNEALFIEQYHWLIYALRSQYRAKIALAAPPKASCVEKLALEVGCPYITLISCENARDTFRQIRHLLRRYPMNFTQAMRY